MQSAPVAEQPHSTPDAALAAEGCPDERTSQREHGRRLRNGIISLVLLLALVVALLLAVPGLRGVERAIGQLDTDEVLAAIGLELVSCLGYVLAFQLVFARAPRRFAARLAWAEMAFGAALSFGGAGSLAVGAWVLRARGVPTGKIAERSTVLFLLTSTINVLVLILFGIGLWSGLLDGPANPLLSVLPAAVGAAVLAFFLMIPGWAERGAARRQGSGRTASLLAGLAGAIRETRRTLLRPDWRLTGPYVYLLADVAVLWVTLRALGHAPPLAAVVLAYQIGYLANILPVPGGIGVLDSGLVGMLVIYGANATTAAAAVLIYHAIALWIPTLFGTIAFVLLRRTLGKPLIPRPSRAA